MDATTTDHDLDAGNDPDVCPHCGQEGGEYTPVLDCCAFCG